MLQLTETTLFHWDLASEFLSHRSSNAKKDFSGPHTKNVQQWVSKVQSTGLPLQAVGRTASNHSYATTIANTELATTSAGSQCLGSSSNDGLGYRRFDFEGSDGAYRDALKNLPRLSQRLPSAVSDSPLRHRSFIHPFQPGHC
jgi:hypothetical protein